MTIEELITLVKNQPDTIEFNSVMKTIEGNYTYTPTRFKNGVELQSIINEAKTNEGSCKIFSFAKINGLNQKETLACFGKFYRDDVLKYPEGNDHGNIRTFMIHGWDGIQFDNEALEKI